MAKSLVTRTLGVAFVSLGLVLSQAVLPMLTRSATRVASRRGSSTTPSLDSSWSVAKVIGKPTEGWRRRRRPHTTGTPCKLPDGVTALGSDATASSGSTCVFRARGFTIARSPHDGSSSSPAPKVQLPR